MTNTVYTNFLRLLASGTVDLLNDRVYVALLSGTYTPNTGHSYYSDISAYEVTDPLASYHVGGQLLSSRTTSIVNGSLIYTAANTNWYTATITAAYAAVWVSGSPSAKYLVTCKDLSGDQTSTNGTFGLSWNTDDGILKFSAS